MPEVQEWNVDKPWLDVKCSLGEGPWYEPETQTLRFLDIIQKRIHTASISGGISSLVTLQLDQAPGVTCDIEGVDPADKILVALKHGLVTLDRKSGAYELVAPHYDSPQDRLRSNDGAADVRGRFWVGSMNDFHVGSVGPEGSLFRYDDKGRHEVLTELEIPNSVGWSPDNKTMYFVRTIPQQILAFDYSVETGEATNQRIFYQHKGNGGPDGFRIDVEGNIWQTFYGESRVLRISPEGKVIGQINLPTKNITCAQFVGTEIFLTSAADETGTGPSKEYGGGVFRVDVGVEGLPLYKYKLPG